MCLRLSIFPAENLPLTNTQLFIHKTLALSAHKVLNSENYFKIKTWFFKKKSEKIILENKLRKTERNTEFPFAELTLIRITETELKMSSLLFSKNVLKTTIKV